MHLLVQLAIQKPDPGRVTPNSRWKFCPRLKWSELSKLRRYFQVTQLHSFHTSVSQTKSKICDLINFLEEIYYQLYFIISIKINCYVCLSFDPGVEFQRLPALKTNLGCGKRKDRPAKGVLIIISDVQHLLFHVPRKDLLCPLFLTVSLVI